MKVADQGHGAAGRVQPFPNDGYRRRRFLVVHGHPDQFRSGLGEVQDLAHGAFDIPGVGIGHGLHDDGGTAADLDFADFYTHGIFSNDHGLNLERQARRRVANVELRS